MASIKFNDLALSEALDRKAMQSIQGALAWINGAFPCWVAPIAIPGAVDVFNFFQFNSYNFQQTTNNNYTTIGQAITSGANSSTTALILGSSMLGSNISHA